MRNLLVLLALAVVAGAADPKLDQAAALYHKTQYDAALRLLDGIQNKDAAAEFLLGRVLYGKGEYKESVEAFERAVALDPQNSQYWDWLGKAYGSRAQKSSFLTAPKYALQCRKAFEKAVELDPKNLEALNEVFLYYLHAPGFLGGGVEKAVAISERLRELDPPAYHNTQAQLAKKRKDFEAAEQHLRNGVQAGSGKVGPLLDLASFLAERGRLQESDALFEKAQQMAPDDPEVMFARASSYVQFKRNLEEARRLLNRYLTSELTPDNPSRDEAQELLRQASSG